MLFRTISIFHSRRRQIFPAFLPAFPVMYYYCLAIRRCLFEFKYRESNALKRGHLNKPQNREESVPFLKNGSIVPQKLMWQGLRFQPNEVRHVHTRFFAQMLQIWEIHTAVLIYVEKSWLVNFCIQTMYGCGVNFKRWDLGLQVSRSKQLNRSRGVDLLISDILSGVTTFDTPPERGDDKLISCSLTYFHTSPTPAEKSLREMILAVKAPSVTSCFAMFLLCELKSLSWTSYIF